MLILCLQARRGLLASANPTTACCMQSYLTLDLQMYAYASAFGYQDS